MMDTPFRLPPIVPHLVVNRGGDAIDFYARALGAELMSRLDNGEGLVMNAGLTINGAAVMLNDHFPGMSPPPPQPGHSAVTIHLTVDNADRWFDRAVAAGATPAMPPADMFWGDRYAVVHDPFGHSWAFAHNLHGHQLGHDEINSNFAAFKEGAMQ
ncbi:VOC family protein [Sandaracinobacteroides saxicola]|uniref:VOC family protein n=1 Tax=Sandaracinobacteroides saxicola TaxID=2759707 RepID=A0A7G5IG41_9SPHN|nr:VOC family protein [Sandaracinobacteroides saxicola]QMW22333.1 VOC family protein [Sandaracinobacteroides saxicola]